MRSLPLSEEEAAPSWAISAAWMVGVSHGEDRPWHFVGFFSAPERTAVGCEQCAPPAEARPVWLSPMSLTDGKRPGAVFMIGQCPHCETVLWGRFAD